MICVTSQRCTRAGSPCRAGYVLFDVLVALLLLATSLLAGGWALIQSLAASRAATLQTTAVDLAADLTESLHVAPPDGTQLSRWQAAVHEQLPAGSGNLITGAESVGGGEIAIRWREHADAAGIVLRLTAPIPFPDPVP